MSSDFGSRSRAKKPPYGWIAAAVLILLGLIGASFIPAWLKARNTAVADFAAWSVDGPPCPTVTPAQFVAERREAPKALLFSEVQFSRQYGHANCLYLHYDGGKSPETFPACQFTSPANLAVVTPKGTFHFTPGLGQPATVFVEHDQPRCVMAINKALF